MVFSRKVFRYANTITTDLGPNTIAADRFYSGGRRVRSFVDRDPAAGRKQILARRAAKHRANVEDLFFG